MSDTLPHAAAAFTATAFTEDQWFDDGWSRFLDWQDPAIMERLAVPAAVPSLVETATDMAAVLLSASPQGAATFALARHERECERGDEERAEFWRLVMAEVRRPVR